MLHHPLQRLFSLASICQYPVNCQGGETTTLKPHLALCHHTVEVDTSATCLPVQSMVIQTKALGAIRFLPQTV